MTFKEALKKLDIEDYGERIFSSNSHGELFHLEQYIYMAKEMPLEATPWFRDWFEDVVRQAEQTWERPESVFQHINTILLQHIDEFKKSQ